MIIESFLFNREFDLLELRLNLGKDDVDFWFIGEGNYTFSGMPKTVNLVDQWDRFKEFEDRIVHVPVDVGWAHNVDYQKSLTAVLSKAVLNKVVDPDAVCIFGDLDEIINPVVYSSLSNYPAGRFEMDFYFYFMDTLTNRVWIDTCFAKRSLLTDLIFLRIYLNQVSANAAYIKNGGWHFSYLGGVEGVVQKCLAHGWKQCADRDYVMRCLKELRYVHDFEDTLGLHKVDVTNRLYPDYILKNMGLYGKHMREEWLRNEGV